MYLRKGVGNVIIAQEQLTTKNSMVLRCLEKRSYIFHREDGLASLCTGYPPILTTVTCEVTSKRTCHAGFAYVQEGHSWSQWLPEKMG